MERAAPDAALTAVDMHRATLNILEDFAAEKTALEGVQRAVVNILEDFEQEKVRLEDMQRAVLNILEDSDLDRTKSNLAYRELHKQTGERERAELEVRKLNADLERRAADLTAANKELEAFSYSVAHDLRAPLRSISGFSAILLEDEAARLGPNGREALDMVIKSTQRMAKLIEDLLNLARVGRTQMLRSSVDMQALAGEVLAELQRGEPPGRVIRASLPPLPAAWGDGALLRQVLTNLLGNALKFTRRRAETLIEVGSLKSEGRDAYFVKDNGEGFDERYSAKLFGLFERLHAERDFEGTGIGLAIVRKAVEKHQGKVWAQGAPGKGAMFCFSLPAREEAG